jgi:hypothetical protein
MITLLFILVIAIFLSVFAFLIGLFKVIFDRKDKSFGVKLITYSVIVFIIGFGSCTALINFGGI